MVKNVLLSCIALCCVIQSSAYLVFQVDSALTQTDINRNKKIKKYAATAGATAATAWLLMKYNDYKEKNTFPVRHAATFSLLVDDFIKSKELLDHNMYLQGQCELQQGENKIDDFFQQEFYLNDKDNRPVHFSNLHDFENRCALNFSPEHGITLYNAHPWGIKNCAENEGKPQRGYFKIILYMFLKKTAIDPKLFKIMINYETIYVYSDSLRSIDSIIPTPMKTSRFFDCYNNTTGKMFTFIVKTLLKPKYREFLKTLTAKDPHFIKLISRAEKEKYYPLYRCRIIADLVNIIEEYVPDYFQLRPGIDFRPPPPPQDPPLDRRID